MKDHNDTQLKERLYELLQAQTSQKPCWSMRYPKLMPLFVELKKIARKLTNFFQPLAHNKSDFFPFINVRHQSLLLRKLWSSDMQLQINKIQNLKLAIEKLNGIVIAPWEIFSFRDLIGKPTYKKGFLDGILISRGTVKCGVGGGLCQLGNLLYRMFLHTDLEVIERHRHSYDIFPDSGRVLPFASWATVFYNYVDLKVRNTTKKPYQIKLWLDDKYLKGQILSHSSRTTNIHLYEQDHCFLSYQWKMYRYNKLKRLIKKWSHQNDELICENLAPVQYEISPEEIHAQGHRFFAL